MGDLIDRQAAIEAVDGALLDGISEGLAIEILAELPSVQPDNDMVHLQKEQAYLQGWEEGREALRKEMWEYGRDRLD